MRASAAWHTLPHWSQVLLLTHSLCSYSKNDPLHLLIWGRSSCRTWDRISCSSDFLRAHSQEKPCEGSRRGQGKHNQARMWPQVTPGEALEDKLLHRPKPVLSWEGMGMERGSYPRLFSSHLTQGQIPGKEAAMWPWHRVGGWRHRRYQVKGIWAGCQQPSLHHASIKHTEIKLGDRARGFKIPRRMHFFVEVKDTAGSLAGKQEQMLSHSPARGTSPHPINLTFEPWTACCSPLWTLQGPGCSRRKQDGTL